ncbi:MAG TPA: VOC family protein, partial [Gaiellaceae bacterium]|nr:VOC family protein [Gaiellaceae bacterium]
MATLPAETRMGPVELTVSDLGRSLDYYREAIGLGVRQEGDGRASLGGDSELLVLHEVPGAQPAPRNTGLFHFALLVPQRRDLAAWLAHAIREQVPMTGVSDHFVSEALYLRDPEGNGIEIYRDRPRSEWEYESNGEVRMGTVALDIDSVMAELPPGDDPGMPEGTRMGHVHLHVADIPAAATFYRDTLGFDETAHLGDQASFFS